MGCSLFCENSWPHIQGNRFFIVPAGPSQLLQRPHCHLLPTMCPLSYHSPSLFPSLSLSLLCFRRLHVSSMAKALCSQQRSVSLKLVDNGTQVGNAPVGARGDVRGQKNRQPQQQCHLRNSLFALCAAGCVSVCRLKPMPEISSRRLTHSLLSPCTGSLSWPPTR